VEWRKELEGDSVGCTETIRLGVLEKTIVMILTAFVVATSTWPVHTSTENSKAIGLIQRDISYIQKDQAKAISGLEAADIRRRLLALEVASMGQGR
jgi:hypothetical protein